MLKQLAFLYSLPLALSLSTIVELQSARPTQAGSIVHFVANTVYPRGVMQQLTVGAKSGLYALDCDQLWYQRNAVLWAAGYCFRERRAARVFGNAACAYDDVSVLPLTDHDWQLISLLQRVEAAKQCYR
jgi:YARHG domain-containing protein